MQLRQRLAQERSLLRWSQLLSYTLDIFTTERFTSIWITYLNRAMTIDFIRRFAVEFHLLRRLCLFSEDHRYARIPFMCLQTRPVSESPALPSRSCRLCLLRFGSCQREEKTILQEEIYTPMTSALLIPCHCADLCCTSPVPGIPRERRVGQQFEHFTHS